MNEFDYTGLVNVIPVSKGDTIDIVVDLFNLSKFAMQLGVSVDANRLIDTFNDKVGPNGNVLIRAFTWDFCRGKGFDIRSSPSQVGALGNVAMKRKDYTRTRHPLYNWLVWGKDKQYLCGIDYKESFGVNSVFDWEAKNDRAYQVLIGSPRTNGLTLFHYVEQQVGVSYRYEKDFKDIYVDYDGKSAEKIYSMYVRDLDYVIETRDCVYIPALEEKGIKVNSKWQDILIETYKIQELCAVYEQDFRKNKIPTGVTLTPIKGKVC